MAGDAGFNDIVKVKKSKKKHYHLGISIKEGKVAMASFNGKPSKKLIKAVQAMCNIAYNELKKQ